MLKQTQFPTTIRTISGNATVYSDDSVLLCDTSTGPVNITLAGIPYNYFSTQYKLFIVDKSNNASTNNITINSGFGTNNNGVLVAQKINAGSSVVINTNGGGCVVRILDNLTYIANNNLFATAGGGGSGYSIIQDEGSSLPSRTKINFTGTGVTATDDAINNATIVNIPSPTIFVSLTYAQATILVSTNALISGATYYITDAANLYVSGGVILQAIANNKFSQSGQAICLNADYQGVGVYTSAPIPYTANLGVWANNLPLVAIGNVSIYNNNMYINTTGVNTANSPDTDAVNWTLLSKTLTTGYIEEVDDVSYDFTTNVINSRKDKRNNYVEFNSGTYNPIITFQWGKNDCYQNQIIGDSTFDGANSRMSFNRNILTNSIYKNRARYNVNQGYFRLNNIDTGVEIDFTQGNYSVFGKIEWNRLSGGDSIGTLYINQIDDTCIFSNNNCETSNIIIETLENLTTISENNFISCAFQVNNIMNSTTFASNFGASGRSIIFVDATNCYLTSNFFLDTVVFYTITNYSYSYGEINREYSTFYTTLDMSDPTIYNPVNKKLSIPQNRGFCGKFELINCAGQTIELIALNNTFNPSLRTYYPANGQTVLFKHTPVASTTNYNLLCDAPGSINTLIGRQPASDYIEYKTTTYLSLGIQLYLRNNVVVLA